MIKKNKIQFKEYYFDGVTYYICETFRYHMQRGEFKWKKEQTVV